MARQQTNKIIGEEKIQQRGGVEQSTRDTFPLLSCFFFYLLYFCLFCLFLHLRDLVSYVLSKGAGGRGEGGGVVAFQGADLLLLLRVCACVLVCVIIFPAFP